MLVVDVTSMCLVVHEWFKNLARSFFCEAWWATCRKKGYKDNEERLTTRSSALQSQQFSDFVPVQVSRLKLC